jgi:CheY-like chemotaxis protein
MNCAQSTRHGRESDTPRCDVGAGGNRAAAHGLAALVVDDDPSSLKLSAAMLNRIGYAVRKAAEGMQALFDLSGAPCELVLTDYEMPGINGYQLGRKIKSQHPATRVVIMTGLSRHAVAGMMSDVSIDGWLFKPFDQAELKTMLERVGLPA